MSDAAVTSAGNPHALLKLLYGGASPLAFSIVEAKDFLSGIKRRDTADDKLKSGAFHDWLYFLGSVLETAVIKDPLPLAMLLVDVAEKDRDTRPDEAHDAIRAAADLLPLIVKRIDNSADRNEFVRLFIRSCNNLFVTEILLVHLSSDVGLWKSGRSFPIDSLYQRDQPPEFNVCAEDILEFQRDWLERVRHAASSGMLVRQRYLLASFTGGDSFQITTTRRSSSLLLVSQRRTIHSR
jgi:hypothetical protein